MSAEIAVRAELFEDELNTILAALRYYQYHNMGDPHRRPDWLQVIACPHPDNTSLDDDAIDSLCERLNLDLSSLTPTREVES